MLNSISQVELKTSLGWIKPGTPIDIPIKRFSLSVHATTNGAKAQSITTGGTLLGYPFGFESTKGGHISLKYVVGLGKKSAICFKGERGLIGATNVLNSFCSKAFRKEGMCARSLNRIDLKVEYQKWPYGLDMHSPLLKRLENAGSVLIFEDQPVNIPIKGKYWLASTSSRIGENDFTYGLDTIEDGVIKNIKLVDEKGRDAITDERQVIALVKLKVDVKESMNRM